MPRITIRKIAFFIFSLFFLGVYFVLVISKNSDVSIPSRDLSTRIQRRHQFQFQKKDSPESLKFYRLDDNGYAISAFLDDRNGNMGYRFVRVLMTLTKKDDFTCFVNSKNSTEANVYEFSENHNMKFGVYILNCKIPPGITDEIQTLEIKRNSGPNRLSIPIQHHIYDTSPISNSVSMSVCVPVLYGSFYSVERIIEFMEYNILQGIQKVNLYIEPKLLENQKMRKMLDYYKTSGVLSYTSFELPFPQNRIWYYGQLITITDCLLKMTGTSKFTFFNDIDELFVPTTNLTMLETLETLFEDKKTGAQRVVLKYIKLENPKVPITLHNTISDERVENRFTKCVIRPEMVFEQGIHHTSRVIQDDYEIQQHDGSLLYVYHYKTQNYCCRNESLIINRFGSRIQKNYFNVYNKLFSQ